MGIGKVTGGMPPTEEETAERIRKSEEMREECPVGTVIWQMQGRHTTDGDGYHKTVWSAVPHCIEHASERGFLTTRYAEYAEEPKHGSSWSLIHEKPEWGGYYLTREMALESFAGRPMVEDYEPPAGVKPTKPGFGDIVPEDTAITIFDGVDVAHIYAGIPFKALDADEHFPVKDRKYAEQAQEATLKEIRGKFPAGVITVFASGPLSGAIYQIGNYHEPKGEKWRYHGSTDGYA